MRAMVLTAPKHPLVLQDIRKPQPNSQQLLLKIHACGICRTDLHVVDGELTKPKLPLIPGHQIVATVEEIGDVVTGFQQGDRVGVPWLGGSCGHCQFCLSGRENLCDEAVFTGYQLDGGFAEYCVADHRFCFPIPQGYPDYQAAPLFCAGLIGYRSLLKAGDAKHLGIYGFGAAAHIITQVAIHQGRKVYAFTRTGDKQAQAFASQLGAEWVGDSQQSPPRQLEAAIIFAPIGDLVPTALRHTEKGGIVVCAGIHMSDIPSFPYEILWGERTVCSVANLTRADGDAFLSLAPDIPVKTDVHIYSLTDVNQALEDLREGRFTGAAVIRIG